MYKKCYTHPFPISPIINTLNSAPDAQTTLHFAAESGNIDIVRLLLDKGADIQPKGNIYTYISEIMIIHRINSVYNEAQDPPRACKKI